jgi:hypothetical protein
MMHHVLRTSLTPPAVAGQLERGVRPHCSRSEDRVVPGAPRAEMAPPPALAWLSVERVVLCCWTAPPSERVALARVVDLP